MENPEDVDIEQLRKTCGIRPDYHYLSNPFGYEGEEEVTNLLEETYANATRPDISYAINRLASYTANPSLEHYRSLKRNSKVLGGNQRLWDNL